MNIAEILFWAWIACAVCWFEILRRNAKYHGNPLGLSQVMFIGLCCLVGWPVFSFIIIAGIVTGFISNQKWKWK